MIGDIKVFEQKVKNNRLKSFINDTLLPKISEAESQYLTLSQYEIMREQVKEGINPVRKRENSQKSSDSESDSQEFSSEFKRRILNPEGEKEEDEDSDEDEPKK